MPPSSLASRKQLLAALDSPAPETPRIPALTVYGPDAHLDSPEAIVRELNKWFAVMQTGGTVAIMREIMDSDGRPEFRFLPVPAFRELLRPRTLNGTPYAKIWLDSSLRRSYDGIVFDPSGKEDQRFFNLWSGWAVSANPLGSCQRFINHVANNVCGGDEHLFTWVMGWFAALIQRPAEKLGTALVLVGAQGTGKTIVGKTIGRLLGAHYDLVSDPRHVTGRFNSRHANLLLLQLDEATWGGDHVAAGKLKDLVTGVHQLIEFKGREPIKVRNLIRLLITSNHDWVVPAGIEERRFAVLRMGEAQMQNAEYFRALDEEMENGGYGALLSYLLTYDLSDINLHQIPDTAALQAQKIASMTPEMSWWYERLVNGELPGDRNGDGNAPTNLLYDHYIATAHKRGVSRRSAETVLGAFLTDVVPGLKRERRTIAGPGGVHREYWYQFPTLAECRAEFNRKSRSDFRWEGDAWTADPNTGTSYLSGKV